MLAVGMLVVLLMTAGPDDPDINSILTDPTCPGTYIGAPCREGCFKVEHYQQIGVFSGRVVSHSADGRPRPVRNVTFHELEPTGSLFKMPVRVTRSGKFKYELKLDRHRYWQCKGGTTQLSDRQQTIRFVLKAPGCHDFELTYDPTWHFQTIDLTCGGTGGTQS